MNQQLINQVFDSFSSLNALVIGDVMIDAYLFGKVDRISPEAPVPVVSITEKDNRLGGAANVALNIKALGANPILCCVVGSDKNAEVFHSLMKAHKLTAAGVIEDDSRPTTVKTRVISGNQQMLRIDEEDSDHLNTAVRSKVIAHILSLLDSEKIDVIIFEDYDKGLISSELIKMVVEKANHKNIPTTVDPKKRNFADYQNVSLFKPNLKELKEGLDIHVDPTSIESLKLVLLIVCLSKSNWTSSSITFCIENKCESL